MVIAALNRRASLPDHGRSPRQGRRYFFAAYSHRDLRVVRSRIARLDEIGVDVSFDDGMELGDGWFDAVAPAIEGSDGVLFFASPRSLESSSCVREISYARSLLKPIVAGPVAAPLWPSGPTVRLADATRFGAAPLRVG